MLHPIIQKLIQPRGAEFAQVHYRTHTACVEPILKSIERMDSRNYMFDVNSIIGWITALSPELNCFTRVSIPLRVPDYNDNKLMKGVTASLKSILRDNSGYIRTDLVIPTNSIKDLKAGKRLNGLSTDLSTMSKNRIKITKQIAESQYFSISPDLFLMVQDGHPDNEMIRVNVYDSKVVVEPGKEINPIVQEIVDVILTTLKEKCILPMHPLMSELKIPDYTFSLTFTIDRLRNQVTLTDGSMFITDDMLRGAAEVYQRPINN